MPPKNNEAKRKYTSLTVTDAQAIKAKLDNLAMWPIKYCSYLPILTDAIRYSEYYKIRKIEHTKLAP